MKRSSLSRVIVFLILLLVGLLLFVYEVFGKTAAHVFFYRTLNRVNDVYMSISKFSTSVNENRSSKEFLKKENETLRKTIENLTSSLQSQQILESQNTELRKLLESGRSNEYAFIRARLVSKTSANGVVKFLLDLGSADGILINTPVGMLKDTNVVVLGIITRLGLQNSVFTPNFNVGITVPVTTSKSKISGFVVGQGSGKSFEFVSSDSTQLQHLIVGEEVLTNSFSREIPKGFYVGKITELSTDPRTLLPSATVSNPISSIAFDSVIIMQKASQKVLND